MAGFTKIRLKDCSLKNIREQNKELKKYNVRDIYHFYSDDDIRLEYEAFLKDDGYFPYDQFPRHEINSFAEFKKYWSPDALGEVFVPKNGTLTFDCYFGRTSNRVMHNIARYLLNNMDEIKCTGGSYSTFVERSGYCEKTQKKLLKLDK